MRLHRLVLTNYRGISHREIDFPDHGVTVVYGVNEAGKSSMIEALDLLLESKDRSTKKDVKQVKPTHADVGSEVTAEISSGAYRFVYRKRFHKKCETELTVLSPRREQLTGDEAHERVLAILDQTVDNGLWQAQRVLQSTSTAAVDVGGSDALSRALDIAAGEAGGGLSGAEPLLIEKIDAEYARYFTATGRPTGEWSAALKTLQAAEDSVAQCAQALAEVDEKTRQHAQLTADVAAVAAELEPAMARHTAAQQAQADIDVLRDQLRTAQAELDAARVAESAAVAAHRDRLRLRADIDARATALAAAVAAAADAVEAEAVGRDMVAAAEEVVVAAAEQLAAAQERADAARATVTALTERDEADRLATRLAKVDTLARELAEVSTQLAPLSLSDSLFRSIEKAAAAVDIARGRVDMIAPRVQVTAEADLELTVGEQTVTLRAGQTHELGASQAVTVRAPGILSTHIDPGATAAEVHTKLVAAQEQLRAQLSQGGVTDLDHARAVHQTRRELLARRDQLSARLADLRGDDDEAALRQRLDGLRAAEPTPVGLFDLDLPQARAEQASADAALTLARSHHATQQKVVAAAVAQLNQRTVAAQVCQANSATAQSELTTAQERLAAARATVVDDELMVRAGSAADAVAGAAQQVQTLTTRLAEAGPEAVAVELTAARQSVTMLGHKHDQLTAALRDVTVELSVFGKEGRSGKLDAAQIQREHALSAHARVSGRARAASLLRTVMARHRDDTRQRYVHPFRTEIERLGRVVFGPSFEVDVDSDLKIVSRTLDGRTVPYDSLSGGAKEQLGIVARLAVAALVDKQDSVPVLIDDALGFTDPQRLAKMCEVLDVAGTHGQVIVLTCVPQRYEGVEGAHHIEVTP
ncbi:hypothetical protein BVC93_19240 [Mycobacterium sp. MS1601]|uniref:AAA family ATPase n=1 Tax=Mycobacterium sp. MS1601 TaxID=1936029 RepID=UPI0009792457|nr:ATP-binding protein [Mycobacterium sp. MS1601]AQA04206.1 hypothetical protein BVC93_19240 [Mycobacterium sp. MS1601]